MDQFLRRVIAKRQEEMMLQHGADLFKKNTRVKLQLRPVRIRKAPIPETRYCARCGEQAQNYVLCRACRITDSFGAHRITARVPNAP